MTACLPKEKCQSVDGKASLIWAGGHKAGHGIEIGERHNNLVSFSLEVFPATRRGHIEDHIEEVVKPARPIAHFEASLDHRPTWV
jgi:hypothetical protein